MNDNYVILATSYKSLKLIVVCSTSLLCVFVIIVILFYLLLFYHCKNKLISLIICCSSDNSALISVMWWAPKESFCILGLVWVFQMQSLHKIRSTFVAWNIVRKVLLCFDWTMARSFNWNTFLDHILANFLEGVLLSPFCSQTQKYVLSCANFCHFCIAKQQQLTFNNDYNTLL